MWTTNGAEIGILINLDYRSISLKFENLVEKIGHPGFWKLTVQCARDVLAVRGISISYRFAGNSFPAYYRFSLPDISLFD